MWLAAPSLAPRGCVQGCTSANGSECAENGSAAEAKGAAADGWLGAKAALGDCCCCCCGGALEGNACCCCISGCCICCAAPKGDASARGKPMC